MRKFFSHCTITKLKKIKRCQRCNKKDVLFKHHKIPVAKGGTNNIKNIIVVCKNCHDILDEEALNKK